jgi:hypothetical protein
MSNRLLEVDKPEALSTLDSSNYFELHIEKFIQGTGSKIVLDIADDGSNRDDDYDISAVYDQGSVKVIKEGEWTFKGFMDNFSKPENLIAALIGLAALVFVLYIVHYRVAKVIRRWTGEH